MSRTIDARETRFGRYFEDFEVGDVYKHWPGKTITEADDHLFCMRQFWMPRPAWARAS